MTVFDPRFARGTRGIQAHFGRGNITPSSDASCLTIQSFKHGTGWQERRGTKLLTDVDKFLAQHQLEISPFSLAIAHDAVTGTDPELARQIQLRTDAGLPVTVAWLEQLASPSETRKDFAQFNALKAKLDNNLEALGRANGQSDPDESSSIISELADIARAMLIHSREIEQAISRSKLQTRSLRSHLLEARKSAEIDYLTGLPNRRAFAETFKAELASTAANNEKLYVAFVDLDHFKKINDVHGHDTGDRVLKVVAQILAAFSNDKCHIARHGGEEFVLLFRGVSAQQAQQCLREAQTTISELNLIDTATGKPIGKITFSGGLADVHAFASGNKALKAADEALYCAKASGRNRLVFADNKVAERKCA